MTNSRILLGRNSVIRKALGSTPESEHLPNASKISAALEGDVGLLFTDEEQNVVEEWFESFKKPDFARAGNIALEGFTVPQGECRLFLCQHLVFLSENPCGGFT